MADLNPNLSPAVTHQPSLLGGAENMKLLFDDTMSDISAGRKMNQRHADAWETLRYRVAHENQTVAHLAQLNVVISAQTGDTAGQQTVSPIRTGAGDNVAAGATPANRIVDTTGAVAAGAVNSATAQATLNNVTAQLAELATQVTGLAQALTDSNAAIAALLAQLVANAKGSPTAS